MASHLAIALVSFSILLSAGRGQASHAENANERHFGFGKQRIALGVGYGFGFEFLRSQDNENSEVEHSFVLPSWSIGITDPLATERWYRGNVDLVGEGQFLINREPRSGFFGAGTLSLRYNFLGLERIVPFISAGAGVGYLAYDLDDQRDGLNFALQTGAGFHLPLADKVGMTAEYRYHHISNANTRDPNAGINSHLFLVGTTIYFN